MSLVKDTKVKKVYVKPVMESEEFVANEYVAACDPKYVWTFNCDFDSSKWSCPWENKTWTIKSNIEDATAEALPSDKGLSSEVSNNSIRYKHTHTNNGGNNPESTYIMPTKANNASV